MKSRNPEIGELVRTSHPKLPIMENNYWWEGYIPTGRIFSRDSFAIVSEIRINMGKLIFSDGTVGWCNLCYLDVINEAR